MASPAAIDRYLAHLVDVVETGTYTDDPADGGGPTRWGITQATLATWRDHPVTAEDVRELSRTEALAILRARYVTEPGFDKLVAIDTGVGMEAIDTGVNMSQTTAARWLQRALNVLNRRGKGWPDIRVDGRCGPKTLGTVRAMQLARGEEGMRVLLTAMNCLQGDRYIQIAEARPSQERFVYGWLRARVMTPAWTSI